jgi:hypothetical protein
MNYDELLKITYADNVSTLKLTERLCKDVITNGIEGDFCEAGVAYGAHGLVMNEVSKGQRVWLFDSFEGIPQYGKEDTEFTESYGKGTGVKNMTTGITVCHLIDVIETMTRYAKLDNITFVKGWFCDTLPKVGKTQKFSILRIDCDIYHSYMDCFKYLLPRLQPGGWLIVDDWVLQGCKQAITDSGLKLDSFTVENDIAYLQWGTPVLQSN